MDEPVSVTALTHNALADVLMERGRQLKKWGDQRHPNKTGAVYANAAEKQKSVNAYTAQRHPKQLSWRQILQEEVLEAYAEADPLALRNELVQVAAVAVAWIEDIDRKQVGKETA